MSEENFKLFDEFDVSAIEVKDKALEPYLVLDGRLMVKYHGRRSTKFAKSRTNILERLANRLAASGHIGKKHKIITGWSTVKHNKNMKTVIETLRLVEKRTGKNPVQVFVDAIHNGSPRDEITVIEHAGARYPQAVYTSPIRRIDLAIRWMVQGAYQKCFGKKKKMFESLAEEIIKAADGNNESYAKGKSNEAEKQADSAR